MKKLSFLILLLHILLVASVYSAPFASRAEANLVNPNIGLVTIQFDQHDVSIVKKSPDTSSVLALQSPSNQKMAGVNVSESMTMSAFRFIPKQGFDEDAVFCDLANSPVERAFADGRVILRGNKLLRLPMPKEFYLDSIAVHSDSTHLFVGYEVNFGGDGNAGLCKFRLADGQRSWCVPFFLSFHEATVSRSGHIYVAGGDTVTQFDALSGKMLWRTENLLSRKMALGIFTTPLEDANGVAFFSWSGAGSAVKRTLVNRQNGRVSSVQNFRPGTVVPLRSARVEGNCTH